MEKITSRENAKVKYACRLASSGAFRRAEGRFLAEGRKLCPELCRGAELETLFCTESALEKCPDLISSSRPVQFLNCVCFMPSSFAFSFIFFTKFGSEPAIFSAMATAASFALAMLMHLIMVSTVWVSFGSKNTCEPPMLAAYSLTLTESVS